MSKRGTGDKKALMHALRPLLKQTGIGAASECLGKVDESEALAAAAGLFLLFEKEADNKALCNLIAALAIAGRHAAASDILAMASDPGRNMEFALDYYVNNIADFCGEQFYRHHRTIFSAAANGLGILNLSKMSASSEARFLAAFLKGRKNPVVLDIGANVGHYAMEVKKHCASARVYCFEPNPAAFARLRKIAPEHGLVIHNKGMSDKEEAVTLYDRQDDAGSGHASLYSDVLAKIHYTEARPEQVHCITVDDFVAASDISHIDLLKLDTEGHEYKILLGALNTLKAGMVDAVHIEFNEMNVIANVFFSDFKDLLPGYHWFRMIADGLVSIDDEPLLFQNLFAFQNIVALSPERFSKKSGGPA